MSVSLDKTPACYLCGQSTVGVFSHIADGKPFDRVTCTVCGFAEVVPVPDVQEWSHAALVRLLDAIETMPA